MAKTLFSLLFLTLTLTLTLISLSTATTTTTITTAHTTLKTFGFPIGLLPTTVASYTLNKTTGDFAINFRNQCKITLPPDNYLATYSKTIKGKIVQNKIAELDGIRVWAFFKWWSITGIKSSGNDLVFEVGLVTAKYPVDKFDEAPSCNGDKADS